MREDAVGNSFSDEETRVVMRDVYQRTGYILDPHGAVGYRALREYQKMESGTISEEIEPDTISASVVIKDWRK